MPGDTPAATHGTVTAPGEDPENVVYLPSGAIPPHPHVDEYAESARRTGDMGAGEPSPVSQLQPVPTPAPELPAPDPNNPFGDFFADGPSAWLEDEDSEDVPIAGRRLRGTFFAAIAIVTLLAGWVVWGIGMWRGAGGAEAGGFILISMLFWIVYLSQPREQQHRWLLRRQAAVDAFVDRRVVRIRERTEHQMGVRRERDRYRAMREERTRRIAALGEGAYRAFRTGKLAPELHPQAQRVLAMERQMLLQDHRLHQMVAEAAEKSAPDDERPEAAAEE
jgi:hypothetical protein